MIQLAALLASDNCLYDIMVGIEHHKDFFDLALKFITIGITVGGGAFVAWRYFRDRMETRATAQLDLKREAYADYFTAIPLNLAALVEFFGNPNAEWVKLPPEGYRAHHRVLLLASHDALQCIVDRNAILHRGVIDLQKNRRERRQFQAVVDGGDRRFEDRLVFLGEDFRERYIALVVDLSKNYRDLLALGRREMEFTGDMTQILETLRKDEEEAVALWRT